MNSVNLGMARLSYGKEESLRDNMLHVTMTVDFGPSLLVKINHKGELLRVGCTLSPRLSVESLATPRLEFCEVSDSSDRSLHVILHVSLHVS